MEMFLMKVMETLEVLIQWGIGIIIHAIATILVMILIYVICFFVVNRKLFFKWFK